MPSIGQNLQPFTGNGDVFIWVKNSRVWRKTTNKQPNIAIIPPLCGLDEILQIRGKTLFNQLKNHSDCYCFPMCLIPGFLLSFVKKNDQSNNTQNGNDQYRSTVYHIEEECTEHNIFINIVIWLIMMIKPYISI